MKKIDATVKRETVFIASWVLIFSAVMEAVFLIIGAWNYSVLFGNLLGAFAAVLNFFLMGLTVQNALEKDENAAKDLVKTSQTLRMMMLIVFAAAACIFDCFDLIAALVPLLFPRIAVAIRPLFDKEIPQNAEGGENN